MDQSGYVAVYMVSHLHDYQLKLHSELETESTYINPPALGNFNDGNVELVMLQR